jgi:hypothetical protein
MTFLQERIYITDDPSKTVQEYTNHKKTAAKPDLEATSLCIRRLRVVVGRSIVVVNLG